MLLTHDANTTPVFPGIPTIPGPSTIELLIFGNLLNPLWLLIGFVLAATGPAVLRRRARRVTVEQLRRRWGTGPDRPLDAQLAAEAWNAVDQAGSQAGVDDHTWVDLHLEEVLGQVDHTHTALGTQNLYRRFRTGLLWMRQPELERVAIRLGTDAELREQVGMILARRGRRLGKGLWIMMRPDAIHLRWWYWSFPALTLAMMLSLAGMVIEPAFLLAACVLACVNLLIRGLTQWQVPGLLTPMGQMAPLLDTAGALSRFPELAATQPPDLTEKLRRLRPLRRIAAWVTRDADPSDVSSVAEWINLIFLLDANALLFGARYIRRDALILKEIAEWIGDVDVALGVASLRAEDRSWCVPEGGDSPELTGEGVWHPLIDSPVENDIELVAGRGAVITGANATGKTTYIRAIGVAALLATVVNTCPARSWKGSSFRVLSMIGGADDLLGGRSYYQVEVERIIELLRASEFSVPTLFLIDELLRGTNTIDRLAVGEAILKELVSGGTARRHCAMIATHDLELTVLLEGIYEAWHFRETMTSAGPTFHHRRHPGPATSRTALALLKAAGAGDEIIAAAQSRADELIERSRARMESLGADSRS